MLQCYTSELGEKEDKVGRGTRQVHCTRPPQSALSGMLRVQAEAGRAFQSRSEPRSKQGGQ